MHKNDFDGFRAELGKLATVFRREMSDELVSSYWDSLKDLALSTVQTRATAHARYAKFFPKPFELRPPEARVPTVHAPTEAFKEGEKRADARLEELRVQDPDEWLKQVTPKVMELGFARGMFLEEIEEKIQRYLREGPRP